MEGQDTWWRIKDEFGSWGCVCQNSGVTRSVTGMHIGTTCIETEVMSGFFQCFPFWFPLLFFYPFLSPLLLTNQVPMNSIKGGTGTVFVLSLISEDIRCTRQVFVFIFVIEIREMGRKGTPCETNVQL